MICTEAKFWQTEAWSKPQGFCQDAEHENSILSVTESSEPGLKQEFRGLRVDVFRLKMPEKALSQSGFSLLRFN